MHWVVHGSWVPSQVDYNLPEISTGIHWFWQQGTPPCWIHRAPFGSMERFISILIEHTAGKFHCGSHQTNIWFFLSPKGSTLRQRHPNRTGSLRYQGTGWWKKWIDRQKIRDTELKRIPYMLIIGDKEVEQNTISVRRQGQGDLGSMTLDAFVKVVEAEIAAG